MGKFVVVFCLVVLGGCGQVKSPGVDASTSDTGSIVPVVTITSMPNAVDGPTATFAFTSDVPATFLCRLDNSTLADCVSPTTYPNLAVGQHRFDVFARDRDQNMGMASYSWQVEPPCTTSTIEAESAATHPGWSVSSGAVLHGGMALEASAAGPAVQFSITFMGKGLIMYGEKGPNRHVTTVKLDSGNPLPVDFNDPAGFSFQIPFPIASGLPNAMHTATITCTTAICAIDYFDVKCQ